MTVDSTRRLDVAGGFRLKDRQKAFADVTVFVVQNKKGPELSIDFGAKKARKHGVRVTSGAYALTVNEDGVDIVGYDERGAFYGLQTLRQLMTSPVADGGRLPYVSINDYPDLPNRGVVEGFYGTPWSHQVRLSLIDFYGRFKLNTYLYGPKDDPYHSSPNWREPYPDKEARQLGELVEACRRNRVDFVWLFIPARTSVGTTRTTPTLSISSTTCTTWAYATSLFSLTTFPGPAPTLASKPNCLTV